ncbi:MAG: hypothetical protein IT186_16110 [Acidobacteria bacterium]|nr:hypothetical protein [Acidobacteriota bacterium]
MPFKSEDPEAVKAAYDKLAELARQIPPERLRMLIAKTLRVSFKVSEAEKADIEETATSLGLTVTSYMTACHHFVKQVLRGQEPGGGR